MFRFEQRASEAAVSRCSFGSGHHYLILDLQIGEVTFVAEACYAALWLTVTAGSLQGASTDEAFGSSLRAKFNAIIRMIRPAIIAIAAPDKPNVGIRNQQQIAEVVTESPQAGAKGEIRRAAMSDISTMPF